MSSVERLWLSLDHRKLTERWETTYWGAKRGSSQDKALSHLWSKGRISSCRSSSIRKTTPLWSILNPTNQMMTLRVGSLNWSWAGYRCNQSQCHNRNSRQRNGGLQTTQISRKKLTLSEDTSMSRHLTNTRKDNQIWTLQEQEWTRPNTLLSQRHSKHSIFSRTWTNSGRSDRRESKFTIKKDQQFTELWIKKTEIAIRSLTTCN